MATKSAFSKYLALPKDHPQHKQFREDLWLGGSEIACRYYLSMILNRDLFVASADDFFKALQEYVIAKSCPEAIQFCYTRLHVHFVLPFLKWEWEVAEGVSGEHRAGKEEQGMIFLVQHPHWTDEQIRQAVKTTKKQMRRWASFNEARAAQKQYEKGLKR